MSISELASTVGISLEARSLALCLSGDTNGDGAISVDELARAVRTALDGCA